MAIKCPKCQTDNPETQKFCGECATPLQPSKDIEVTKTLETPKEELTRGTTLANRYEIIEELGKGGMGRVYRVEDTKLKHEVALKLIKSEIAKDKKTIERFRNELKLARNIRHKNVCGMFDLGETEGAHFITMEYIRGEDLKSFIHRSGQLAVGTTVRVVKQVCEGLSEAHKLGVVHRDLKSNNIMIDKEGNVRIMDFGIARSLEAKGITGAGVMIGTPEYMSPEQIEGKEVDQRSDIYSLGVILYEMVTGQVPFEGDTPLSIAMKHKGEMPKDPRNLNPQIPEDMSLLILKCMEKDKKNRYQSAEELHAELDNIEKGIPTTQREITKKETITSKEITVKFRLKNLLIPALAVVAAIVVGLFIWRPWSQKEATPIPSDKPSLAVVYFENNSGDESLDHWRKALCELLIADLTQSKYIRVLSSDKLIDILSDLNQMEARSFSSRVLREVAVRGGSTHILRGSFTRAGEQFRIDAILQEAATMESIGSNRIDGKGEESFLSMVDDLTKKVKEHFKLSKEEIAGDLDEEIGKITTSSPEALKYYIEGRRYHLARDNIRSIELMEKAVAIDPDFAMAYRSMAMSYSNRRFRPQQKKCLQKALELSDRLPARERYLIEASYYSFSEKTKDKSIEAYKKLLELYPDDPTGNHNLALNYSSMGERYKAIKHYETNRKNGNLYTIGYANLADVYRRVGSHDKAREVLEEAIQKYPDMGAFRRNLAHHYRMTGKYDLALAEIDKAFALEPDNIGNFSSRAAIYFYRGDLVKAAEAYRWLLKQKRPEVMYRGHQGLLRLNILQGKFHESKDLLRQLIDLSEKYGLNWPISECYLRFAYIDLKTGNPQAALKDCDSAIDYALKAETPSRQRRALHLKGLSYIQINAMDEGLKAADELKALVRKANNPELMHLYHHLIGMIELKQKSFNRAIECFKEALTLQSDDPLDKRADYVESLAMAYYASGNLDKAKAEYEGIVSASAGRLDYGDSYARSLYALGKIYEQQGDKGKAIEHYEKFLSLWKDADHGVAEMEDVRKRLAGLQKTKQNSI